MGLVPWEGDGRRIVYVRDSAHPQGRAIESLVGASAPANVLRDVLREVPGVEAAFIFGSRGGDARPDSDIDLLVYGDSIRDGDLGGALLDARRWGCPTRWMPGATAGRAFFGMRGPARAFSPPRSRVPSSG